jgi:hypothetical protein
MASSQFGPSTTVFTPKVSVKRAARERDKVAAVQSAFSVQQTIISLHVVNSFSTLSLLIFAKIILAVSPFFSLPARNNSTVAAADIIQHFVLSCCLMCEI